MEEVKFTEEQLEYIKNTLNEELGVMTKYIQENCIPILVVEKLLEHTKKQKETIKDKAKLIYLDGMIFAFEELLKKDWDKE